MENEKTADKDFLKDREELRMLLINNMADLSLQRKVLDSYSEPAPRLLRISTRTTFWYGLGGLIGSGIAAIIRSAQDLERSSIVPLIAVASVCLVIIGVVQIIIMNRAQIKSNATKRCMLNAKISNLEIYLRSVDKDLGIPHERTRHEVRVAISQKEIKAPGLYK